LLALSLAGSAATAPAQAPLTEVVVTLSSPSLAMAFGNGMLPGKAGINAKRLALKSKASSAYLGRLAGRQVKLSHRIEKAIPRASVRRHYRVVADGLAVSLPSDEISTLEKLPGVARVYPSYRYRALDTEAPADVSSIGAPDLWGTDLASAGQGVKIGVIDEGVDQKHPYFDPAGYSYPAGFPKGNSAYTTPKVIVARAFPARGLKYANASLPFDSRYSFHGTHVAGIAAGNAGTSTAPEGGSQVISGVAPRAYLGNYKALTIPTENFGLNGNSPEIVAAIEAAVSDGMDVINLSIGEPEIDPHNDIVAKAVNAASAAGVVVTVAAGNEFSENGRGSISSPGTARSAITVGASSSAGVASKIRIAGFSSSGPTPYDFLLKPDVSAPGIDILSSLPSEDGTWGVESGTSMAAPHVAGASALLLQRHSTWTPAQIKSALALTADPITNSEGRRITPLRVGTGRIDLTAADQPLVFATPSTAGFGLVAPGRERKRTIDLADAGGAVGSCQVGLERSDKTAGASINAPTSVSVPGTLALEARARPKAKGGELDGWVRLSCSGRTLRIPFWVHVAVSHLRAKKKTRISRPGVYTGNTKGKSSRVGRYLYPERVPGVKRRLKGPEQVFRLELKRSHQNFGVAVVSHGKRVSVTPRIVRKSNEDKLTGLTALPVNVNPYVSRYADEVPAAGALRPSRGTYDIVFDTVSKAMAGSFTFRFWIDDTKPPRLRVLSRKEGRLTLRISDRGSGVDPASITASSDGRRLPLSFHACTGKAVVDARRLNPGRHAIVVTASDFQESKNNENATRLLPNTATIRSSIRITR
jgi:subtilisin family serine protease